jgi:hypothetical protein
VEKQQQQQTQRSQRSGGQVSRAEAGDRRRRRRSRIYVAAPLLADEVEKGPGSPRLVSLSMDGGCSNPCPPPCCIPALIVRSIALLDKMPDLGLGAAPLASLDSLSGSPERSFKATSRSPATAANHQVNGRVESCLGHGRPEAAQHMNRSIILEAGRSDGHHIEPRTCRPPPLGRIWDGAACSSSSTGELHRTASIMLLLFLLLLQL